MTVDTEPKYRRGVTYACPTCGTRQRAARNYLGMWCGGLRRHPLAALRPVEDTTST